MKNSDFDEVGEADDLFFKPLLVHFGLFRLGRGPGGTNKGKYSKLSLQVSISRVFLSSKGEVLVSR